MGVEKGQLACAASVLRLMPRTSAGERSSRSLSWRPGSTVVGPPFLYTPVYVDCARQGRRHGQHWPGWFVCASVQSQEPK